MRWRSVGGEARQREIVQVDEAVEEMPGGIDLYRQPSFREVDLYFVTRPFPDSDGSRFRAHAADRR